ncbi:MAG: response regulator transcription factor [Dehalococcoidia bacterium]|nr:MAG: response regulator transcription factor [Dehalococcoidia bacterium]
MNEQSIKTWVFSQQPLFRQGLHNTFSDVKDIEIVGEAQLTDKMSRTIEIMPPDVAIIDIDTAPDSGLNLVNRVKQVTPSTEVIVLASDINDEYLFEAIKRQAAAYLSKDIQSEELINIVRRVVHGEHPINESLNNRPKVAAHILNQFQELYQQQEVENLISPLTARETEIVNFMAQGYANKQIAVSLKISEQTIKNHVTSILSKLDANARTEAVVKAIKRGLITFQQE